MCPPWERQRPTVYQHEIRGKQPSVKPWGENGATPSPFCFRAEKTRKVHEGFASVPQRACNRRCRAGLPFRMASPVWKSPAGKRRVPSLTYVARRKLQTKCGRTENIWPTKSLTANRSPTPNESADPRHSRSFVTAPSEGAKKNCAKQAFVFGLGESARGKGPGPRADGLQTNGPKERTPAAKVRRATRSTFRGSPSAPRNLAACPDENDFAMGPRKTKASPRLAAGAGRLFLAGGAKGRKEKAGGPGDYPARFENDPDHPK